MSSAFEAYLEVRNAGDYADFLLPHLDDDFRLLDVGCGEGPIALGLTETVAHVDAVDGVRRALAIAHLLHCSPLAGVRRGVLPL